MPGKFSTPPARLQRAGLVILVAGLLAALCVYLAAANTPDANSAGYRIVDGHAYASALDGSDREMQELERLGGKASVWTYRFDRWLASLWHGQRLAGTLAVLSLVISWGCFHLAGLMAEDPDA
jgi:hypothetical protein